MLGFERTSESLSWFPPAEVQNCSEQPKPANLYQSNAFRERWAERGKGPPKPLAVATRRAHDLFGQAIDSFTGLA